MKIYQDIEIIGKSLWLSKEKILIIADLHLGYEECLNAQGVLVPRHQFQETSNDLNKIFKEIELKKQKISKIIINGDLKHEFGEISRQEWNETSKILDILQEKCKEIILIKGNHDTILEPIAKRKGLKIIDFYCMGDICILHGQKVLINPETSKAKILIIAHEHPAVSLREGAKSELYKCFLLGKFKSNKLVVMPSFLPIIEGSDIKKERVLSPYLKQNLRNFEVFIVADKVYKFSKLKNI
ncbi:phosphoesterase [Candidatus Pacearchaeota archaeon CG06_land_8_20_14_3_00_35_12]|nr:MAG: phosphoesterase [Candidatus Pacearchaeota archaeon CG06_land_8_20_14_3_00_35_12]